MVSKVKVLRETSAPQEVAKQRAQEGLANLEALLEAAQGVVTRLTSNLDLLKNNSAKLTGKIEELREATKKEDLLSRNKAVAALSRNAESIRDTELSLEEAKKSLEEATNRYNAATRTIPTPPAAMQEAAKAKVDEQVAIATREGEVLRSKKTSPSVTKAVNAGVVVPAIPEPLTPRRTEAERTQFKSELDVLGLTTSPDINGVIKALNYLATKGGTGSTHFKALARIFSDKPALLNGVNGVEIVDNPSLAADVSVIDGVLTFNVDAMTATLDGTPRGPEALLRGLITHAATSLTSPDAVLNASQREALTELEALRQEAISEEANTRAAGLNPRFTDALKDTPSFINAMLMSPEFAEMLQTFNTSIKAPSLKSPWGRFWAAVGKLLTGKPVASGSALHAGLMAAGKLMVNSPNEGKKFRDFLMAVIHNPAASIPEANTAGAEEITHQQNVNDAVEQANSPTSRDTVEARLLGDTTAAANPEEVNESNDALMPPGSMLGRLPEAPGIGRVTFVPRVAPQAPSGSETLTDQQAFAGLADAIRTVDLVDKVARGVLTPDEAGAAVTPSAIQSALDSIAPALERLKNSPAPNKDQFIALLEDMQAFLQLEQDQIVAPPARFDDLSESVQNIDTESLPTESDMPVVEPAEEGDVPFAEPYVEVTTEDGSKKPLDFNSFLRAASVKTGRRVAMVDAGPGVPEQPLYVRHDRTDITIYMNKSAMTALVEKLRAAGYSTKDITARINAILDREASTLAILQRFSDGELIATARSLDYKQQRKLIKRVYDLNSGDAGFMDYLSRGKSGASQDVTADMIQMGADYYRMMRQVAETGHTTEDVLDMLSSSPGTFARTSAFLKAYANQFMTWWRAYGDVAATRAIVNIDEFLHAVTPAIPNAPSVLAAPIKKVPKHEAAKLVANAKGLSIEEVLADVKMVKRIRKSMKQHVLGNDSPETTVMTVAEARDFVKSLGLVNRDPKSVATALSRIADMPNVNPAFRVIAQQLSQNPQINALADFTFVTDAETTVDGAVVPSAGLYSLAENTLELEMPFMIEELSSFTPSEKVVWSQAFVVETFLHEAIHAVTSRTVQDYNSGVTMSPKVKAAIEGLERLRLAVSNQKGASKFSYGLSNLDEYIAAVSSDPNFVAWLAALPPSVGADVLGETGEMSVIQRILRRIYQIIFPNTEPDSALQKSLSRVFDLAAYPHLAANPTKTKLNKAYRKKLANTALKRQQALDEAAAAAQEMEAQLPGYDAEQAELEAELSAEAAALDVDPEDELAAEAQAADEEAEAALAAYEAKLAKGLLYAPMKTSRLRPGRVTGERKVTTALENSMPVMPARVQDYLKESTYFSEVGNLNIKVVEEALGKKLAKATGSADFAKIAISIDDLRFTDAQRYLARVVVGQALNRRIFDLQEAMMKAPTPGGLGLLEDYEGVAKNVWRRIQEVASNSGQVLSAANIGRDLINPKIVAATYRDAATDVAGAKLPGDAKELFTDLQAEADEVAADVVKKSKLTKKIVEAMTKSSGGDPAEVQMMFDFMSTMQDYLDRGTGVPVPAKMADWVADQMLGMVDSKIRAEIKKVAAAAGVSEQTFFEEYSDEVKRQVSQRINQALADAAPETAEMTPAQREAAKKEALKAAIQEMVSSFEFAPSVERALNQSKAKLLARLEAEKGSTPEALKRYDDAKAAIAAMKFDLVPMNKALDIIRRSFDMREQVYLSLSEQRANVAQLAAMISNAAGLNDDQARKVAEAFKAAYEAEMNRRVQKTLTSYVARRSKRGELGNVERYSRSERFLRLARIGGLRKEEFYNAMASEFDLPSYDPAIADELDREANRIMAMPVGSVQRNDATRELNARIVNESYKNLLNAYGPKAIVKDNGMMWEYLAGIPVAMWKSGVLSGLGTSEVNFLMGTAQSVMDLGFNATAYAVKAKDPALAASNLLTLMRAVSWIGDPIQRKEVWLEMRRAALTGRTRFGSEQSENMLVLERDIPTPDLPVIKQLMSSAKAFYKGLGRIGSVIDATVSVPASIARQRLALQYALTMSGADRKKIAEIMRKSFSPDELESREINEILEAEKEQFRNTPRPDLAMEARRFQLVEQRRAQTYADLTSRLDAKSKEDFMDASRESARFANLGTTPTGLSGAIFDRVFGSIERKTKGLSSIVVSFPRAMGNLLDFSLAMSVPGLSFWRANNVSPSSRFLSEDSPYRREFVEKDSLKYWKLMAQGWVALTVQATLGALYWYGLEDEDEGRVPWFMVYGKGYPDSERNRQLRYRQPNWSPYTVKIGGIYLSWKDLPGFNLLLGGLAALTDDRMVTGLKDPTKIRGVEAAANTAVAFIKAVTVKNSLQGLAQAGEILSDNDLAEAASAKNIGKMLTNFLSGASNPRLLRDATDIGRGIASGGEFTLKDTRGFTAAAISMLPANSLYGAALGQNDMLNSMGDPVTNFWFAPATKRILPITAGPSVNPIMTPLVSAGLFISPVKASQMSFDTFKTDSDEIDTKGGLLSSFSPEVEADAVKLFGEQMRLRLTPEYIKELTDLAEEGQAGRELAQKALNKVSEAARDYAKGVIQNRIFDREIVPHWQEK